MYPICVFSQENIYIKGVISDKKSKDPLIGASIYLGKTNRGTSTDLDGYFDISINKKSLPDTLKISYIGYETLIEIITATQEDTLLLNLGLNPSKNTQLEGITINAGLPITEDFIVNKLNFLDVVLNPSSSADPLLAVRSLPSSTTTDESASISFRGSSPSQTGIFLNEVPIYDAVKFAQLSGIGTFSIFNINLIKNILVFPSNPPLEYGNSGAGLISLTTEEKQSPNFAEFSIGLAQSSIMAGINIGKKSMLKIFGNNQIHKGLKLLSPNAFNELNSFNLLDGGFHLATSLNKNWQIKLFFYSINENYNVDFPHPSLKEKTDYSYKKNRFFNTTLIEKTHERYVFSLKQGFSKGVQSDFVGNYNNQQENLDLYLGIDYRYFFSEKFTLKTGISYDSRNFNLDSYFPANSYDYRKESFSFRDTSNFGRSINESYLYGKYLFSKKLTTGIGIRKNLTKIDNNYWSKQAHIRYSFTETHYLNFSIGESNSFIKIDFHEFKRIKTIQYSLDYAFEKENTKASFAVYKKNEKYPLFFQKTHGFEMFYRRMMKKWIFELSYSSNLSKINDSIGIYSSVYNIPLFLKNTLQVDLDILTLGISTNFRTGTPFTPISFGIRNEELDVFQPIYDVKNSEVMPNYFRTDLLLSKNILSKKKNNGLIIYFNVGNIFNSLNTRDYIYNYDYLERTVTHFQKRTLYFGFTYNIK
jgi:hypothetical protein